MAQVPAEHSSDGNKARGPASGPRGGGDRPLTDGHLLALLGAADPDLHDAMLILALSGMRLAELRRLRVGQCGRGAFRVGGCAASDGARAVPVHTALAGTVLRLTSGRAGNAFVFAEGRACKLVGGWFRSGSLLAHGGAGTGAETGMAGETGRGAGAWRGGGDRGRPDRARRGGRPG